MNEICICRLRIKSITCAYRIINTQTPRFAHAQNSVNTREFCTTSINGKDLMFNYVARVLTRTCGFYISYGINDTLIKGFLIGYQENIKIPQPHGINHTVIRVSYRFQEDIKIIITAIIVIITIIIW